MLRLFERRKLKKQQPALPSLGGFGRVYAVGDVHGRFDLFVAMLRAIALDLDDWIGKPFQIIFLGDLIDRGPRSRDVVELAQKLACTTARVRFIAGNHEEVFLRALDGDTRACDFFWKIGGKETLESYGLDGELEKDLSAEDLVNWMQEAVPADHIAFLGSFEDMIILSDYVFVHAGIRPKVALEQQNKSDLRWIRDPFLGYQGIHPAMVVHGHSISEEVDEQPNRIGIDTGAYCSGKLTAIVLEAQRRKFLTVSDDDVMPGAEDNPLLLFGSLPTEAHLSLQP